MRLEVVTLLLLDDRLWSIHENGSLCQTDLSTGDVVSSERRWGKIKSAGSLAWLGTTRVLLSGEDGALQCVGLNAPLVTHYSSPHRGLRVVLGGLGFVAGVSADRQRVIIWNIWEGRQPGSEIFVGALAKHRIADIATS